MEQQGMQRMLISLTALTIMGAAAYYLHYNTPPHPQEVEATYRMITHNTAGINNNPIEYTTVLQNLAKSSDSQVAAAANKLLAIDRRISPSLPIVTIMDGEVLYDLCQALLAKQKSAIQQQIKEEQGHHVEQDDFVDKATDEEVRSFVDAFVEAHQEMTAHDFFLERKFSSTIDKPMRTLGITRFSPTFYDAGMILYLQQLPLTKKTLLPVG